MEDSESVEGMEKFVWINWIPSKLNCFVWRMQQNSIPVLNNLSKCGINVSCPMCPVCLPVEEDVDHLFFTCSFAREVWSWFGRWTRAGNFMPDNFSNLLHEVKNKYREKKTRKLHMALSYVVLWLLWKSRNEKVFQKKKNSPLRTADDIQVINRARYSCLNWHEWGVYPSLN